MAWIRDANAAGASGESCGALAGCCAGNAAQMDSELRRFDGESDAAAETKEARRANSRREMAESVLLPIEAPLDQNKQCKTISERRKVRLLNLCSSVNWPSSLARRTK